MNNELITKRVEGLLARYQVGAASGHELMSSALSLLSKTYGSSHPLVRDLAEKSTSLNDRYVGEGLNRALAPIAIGALQNLSAELKAGLAGDLQNEIAGAIFTDFVLLSRTVLEEPGDDAKNVSAVLAAALFEDTLRRLATHSGLAHIPKLQDVLIELRDQGILKGTQVGIANAYLNFRNSALHAQWDRITRDAVASVQAFVEQILLEKFT